MGIDVVTLTLAKNYTKKYVEEHTGGQAVLVGTVTNGDSFPVKRKDGTDLILGDFVKPAKTSTLPFTIAGITFNSYNDQAVFAGGTDWLYNANPFQNTAETPVQSKANESLSGTSTYQSQVNAENKDAINNKIDKIDTTVSIEHAVVKRADGSYNLMQINSNSNAANTIVRRDNDKQINVPLTPLADDDATSKKYVDEHTPTMDSELSDSSENGVQNKVLKAEFDKKVDRTVTEDSGAKSIIDNQKGQHGSVMQSVFGDTIVSFNTADENGEDGITAQIYSKKISTNQGTRLNVTSNGMFYGKGTSASTDPEKEIATKGDVNSSGAILVINTIPGNPDPRTGTFDKTVEEINHAIEDNKKLIVKFKPGQYATTYHWFDLMYYTKDSTKTSLYFTKNSIQNPSYATLEYMTWDSESGTYATGYLYISERIQFDSMPSPGSLYAGKVYQYVGSTTENYTKGCWYKCENVSGSWKWVLVDIKEAVDDLTIDRNASGQLEIKNKSITLDQINDDNIGTSILEDPVPTKLATNQAVYQFAKTDGETIEHDAEEGIRLKNAEEYLKKEDVKDNVISTDTDKPLSAKQGKNLSDRISSLEARGRYLSTWDCTTGKPGDEPTTPLPYDYKPGDYYTIFKVNAGGTNYRPNGTQYTGGASTTVESEKVDINYRYEYSGTGWNLIGSTSEVAFSGINGDPYDNSNLATALNAKANESDLEDHLGDLDIHTSASQKAVWNGKQDKLTAGTNITIDSDNVIDLKNADTYLKKTDVKDDLTSTDTDKPLSAKQGKVLNDSKEDVSNKVDSLDSYLSEEKYPNAACVKEKFDMVRTSINAHTSQISDLSREVDKKENLSNKVTSIDDSSTDTQYPSAKAVNTYVDTKAKFTLNGEEKETSTANFYAPTNAGTSGQILQSNGSGAPTWVDRKEVVANMSNITNYLQPASNRVTIDDAAIVKQGNVYSMKIMFKFTANKATWAANTEWLNLFTCTSSMQTISKQGFNGTIRDPNNGNYGGAISSIGGGTIGLWPWKQITTSGLTSTSFSMIATWISV